MLLAPTVLRKGSLLREGNEPYIKVQEIKMHRPNQNQINLRGGENPQNARSVLELGGNENEDSMSILLRKISEMKDKTYSAPSAWNPLSYFLNDPQLTAGNDLTNSSILGQAMQQDVSIDSEVGIKRASNIGVNDGSVLTSTLQKSDSKNNIGRRTTMTMIKPEAMQFSIGQPSVSIHRKILFVPTSFFTFDFLDGTGWNLSEEVKILRESELTLSLIFVMSGALSLSVGILLVLHTYLVLSAQTTIEFFQSFPLRSKFK